MIYTGREGSYTKPWGEVVELLYDLTSLRDDGWNGIGTYDNYYYGENYIIICFYKYLYPNKSLKILKFNYNGNLIDTLNTSIVSSNSNSLFITYDEINDIIYFIDRTSTTSNSIHIRNFSLTLNTYQSFPFSHYNILYLNNFLYSFKDSSLYLYKINTSDFTYNYQQISSSVPAGEGKLFYYNNNFYSVKSGSTNNFFYCLDNNYAFGIYEIATLSKGSISAIYDINLEGYFSGYGKIVSLSGDYKFISNYNGSIIYILTNPIGYQISPAFSSIRNNYIFGVIVNNSKYFLGKYHTSNLVLT
jgi:hypothetical protein